MVTVLVITSVLSLQRVGKVFECIEKGPRMSRQRAMNVLKETSECLKKALICKNQVIEFLEKKKLLELLGKRH